MYCDKDSDGKYSIQDLSMSEFEIIRSALMAYRVSMCSKLCETEERVIMNYIESEFNIAGNIVRAIKMLKI